MIDLSGQDPWEDAISFRVIGDPVGQGSLTAMPLADGRIVLVNGKTAEGRRRHASWREAIAATARRWLEDHPRPPLDEPVAVRVEFLFASVRSDPYRTAHATKPDVDKLARLVLDSLTDSGLLRDDARVFALYVSKRYADEDEVVGARISVLPCGEWEEAARAERKAEVARQRKRARQASKAYLS